MKKIMISKEKLKKLYLRDKLPITEIAKRYGRSKNSVSYWLRKHKIKLRSASESMKLFVNKPEIEIPKKELCRLYFKEGWGLSKLAKKYNCSIGIIQQRLRKYGFKLRYSKGKKIKISKKELEDLYINRKLTTYKISDKFNCCQATIWKRLKRFRIKRRTPHELNSNVPSKEKLKNLYVKRRLSTWGIERRYGYSRSTVHRKLKEFGMIRNRAVSHIVYPRKNFDGSKTIKAYMIGFKLGDLRARKIWKNSETIHVDCGSSINEQIILIKNLFNGYGRVWIKRIKSRKSYFQIEAYLNDSFSFLLKQKAPGWVFKNKGYFFSFLAGFTDAEGTISITNKNQAYYSVVNQNKYLLNKIRNKLIDLGINCTQLNLQSKKGTPKIEGDKIYYSNADCWTLRISRKIYLLKLLKNLEPYIKHGKKVNNLKLAKLNILERNRKFGL